MVFSRSSHRNFLVPRWYNRAPICAYLQLYRTADLLNMAASIWTSGNNKLTKQINVPSPSWRLLPDLILLQTDGPMRIFVPFKTKIFCTISRKAFPKRFAASPISSPSQRNHIIEFFFHLKQKNTYNESNAVCCMLGWTTVCKQLQPTRYKCQCPSKPILAERIS